MTGTSGPSWPRRLLQSEADWLKQLTRVRNKISTFTEAIANRCDCVKCGLVLEFALFFQILLVLPLWTAFIVVHSRLKLVIVIFEADSTAERYSALGTRL